MLKKQEMNVKDFVKKVFPEYTENVAQGKCPFCGKDIKEEDFTDSLSLKEFKISGLCQECQNNFFDADINEVHSR